MPLDKYQYALKWSKRVGYEGNYGDPSLVGWANVEDRI